MQTACIGRNLMTALSHGDELARIRPTRSLFANGGWSYDAYPELDPLSAHTTITIARFDGPGIVDHIHVTQLWPGLPESVGTEEERRAIAARGVVVEVYVDDVAVPTVRVPLGDFFADAARGNGIRYSGLLVEKAPQSYNCWIPMPFARSIRIVLVNETEWDLYCYTFVEGHPLPEWDPSLGYFHATWNRWAFQVGADTDEPFLHLDGAGHLLGRSWAISTDEPGFEGMGWVMEGNNEFRIDGESEPAVDYLGTEDSFGFSWGFQNEFVGLRNGITHLGTSPTTLGVHRFHDLAPIRFSSSLDLRVDWSTELSQDRGGNIPESYLAELRELASQDRLWVDYATTSYWYQDRIGHDHAPMPSLVDRIAPLLRPNAVGH
jgi:hypothetical protein